MNSIFVWECPNLTMVGCFSSLQHQRVITNGATDSYTALYRKQREHALGGDHITIPDELEKNGQPQNEKMKFESSKHETKLSMKLTAQVQARILSKAHTCREPANKPGKTN